MIDALTEKSEHIQGYLVFSCYARLIFSAEYYLGKLNFTENKWKSSPFNFDVSGKMECKNKYSIVS